MFGISLPKVDRSHALWRPLSRTQRATFTALTALLLAVTTAAAAWYFTATLALNGRTASIGSFTYSLPTAVVVLDVPPSGILCTITGTAGAYTGQMGTSVSPASLGDKCRFGWTAQNTSSTTTFYTSELQGDPTFGGWLIVTEPACGQVLAPSASAIYTADFEVGPGSDPNSPFNAALSVNYDLAAPTCP